MEKGMSKAIFIIFIELVNMLLLFSQLMFFAFGIMNQSIDAPLPSYYTYAHLFTFVILIWFGVYLFRDIFQELRMIKKPLKYLTAKIFIPYRVLLILLGLLTLYYQLELFFFEYSKSGIENDIIFVFLTILVVIWFIVHQVKLLFKRTLPD